MPLKVCAVTSSRADWGLLVPVLKLLRDDSAFNLQLFVTGQHLADSSGKSVNTITTDGFMIAETIDMNLVDDTPSGITASLSKAIAGIGGALDRIKPDLMLVLGDRYEILGAVMAASLARVPVAHLCGGDVTEGAMDDAFRHAITKMAHLHFVSNAEAERRVQQLGEAPDCVFLVGSPGLDHIRTATLLDRSAFFQAVGLEPRPKNLMITFHPETLASDTPLYCTEMLAALDRLGPNFGLLFSGTNADVYGLTIGELIADFVASHTNAVLHPSLGTIKYLSALKHCDLVVGNSSSGLYEAPSFEIPTVNIGDRQKGRLKAGSVIDAHPHRDAIAKAIADGLTRDCRGVANPYGDGHTAEKIIAVLKTIGDPARLLKKKFIDWPTP